LLDDLQHLDDIDLAQFVMGPERELSMPSDRRIIWTGMILGAGFTLLIVMVVIIAVLLEHR
jgi:hypothetical protein